MLLSEAMRLGTLLRPQAFGLAYDGRGTCALGAALDAIGRLGTTFIGDAFPLVLQPNSRCPDRCGEGSDTADNPSIENIIIHLNDHHHWTREQIADWVAQYEQPTGVTAMIVQEEVAYAAQ